MFRQTRPTREPTAKRRLRRQQSVFVAYATQIILCLFILGVMGAFVPEFGAALLLLIVVFTIALYRPAVALGLAIVLTIVGDGLAMPWWPVVKNFSSRESVLFVTDSLTLKPLEFILLAILAVWLVSRRLDKSAPPIEYGPFWHPLVIFTTTVFIGLFWGLGRGGDLRVAVFEVAPLLYVPAVYLAATNLFTSLRHYHQLLWGILAALTVEAVHGLIRLSEIRSAIAEDASPVEHTAALHMNLLFLALIATTWFGTRHWGRRPVLLLLVIPTLVLYLDAERRAAVVGLIIGGVSLAVVLYTRNRQKFFRIIPLMLTIGVVYCGAFWNAQSQAGFPAQAVKIIVQPDASPEKDASSDLYREIENFDLNATIRSNPLLGIGFGKPFLQPIPLPDISFFEFADYVPHNSVLWVWTKTGVVGFVTFLYMFALGIAVGVRAARSMTDPDDAALVATMAAYIPMTLVVAFVDITFDSQTMVLFGAALALVGSAERLSEKPGATDTRTRTSLARLASREGLG